MTDRKTAEKAWFGGKGDCFVSTSTSSITPRGGGSRFYGVSAETILEFKRIAATHNLTYEEALAALKGILNTDPKVMAEYWVSRLEKEVNND